MKSLYHVVYLSVASSIMEEKELEEFLIEIRKKNRKYGVTGMLLYNNESGNFIQVIEGKQDVIEKLFDIISKDERHSTIVKMLEGPIEERMFPNWSMGYRRISSKQSSRIRGFSNYMNDEVSMENLLGSTNEVMELFQQFKKFT